MKLSNTNDNLSRLLPQFLLKLICNIITQRIVLVADETGTVEVVFFNGRYIANLFNINQEYTFYGRVTANYDRMQMVHPEFHKKGDPSGMPALTKLCAFLGPMPFKVSILSVSCISFNYL